MTRRPVFTWPCEEAPEQALVRGGGVEVLIGSHGWVPALISQAGAAAGTAAGAAAAAAPTLGTKQSETEGAVAAAAAAVTGGLDEGTTEVKLGVNGEGRSVEVMFDRVRPRMAWNEAGWEPAEVGDYEGLLLEDFEKSDDEEEEEEWEEEEEGGGIGGGGGGGSGGGEG